MYGTKMLICRYLKGSPEGARCAVINQLLRSIEDADIRLCMNRHHEACAYYVLSLREIVFEDSGSDSVAGTL